MLAGPDRAFDNGIHDLQMRRIERQRQVHRSARRHDVGRESLVILDVAGKQRIVVPALEFGKQVLGHLPQRVHQHVEPAPVGHADHQFLHPVLAGTLQQIVKHRDQHVAAFEREALLPDIAGMEISLQSLGRGEAFQNMALVIRGVAGLGPNRLETFLNPQLLHSAAQVHVLDAERAAVGLLKRLDDFTQRRLLGADQRAGVEHRVHIGFGQVVIRGFQFGDMRALAPLERVELRKKHSAEAVLRDQLNHRNLLAVESDLRGCHAGRPCPCALHERFDNRRMRYIARTRQMLDLVEVTPPLRCHRVGILQVGLVQILDERRVAAEQVRAAEEFLHHGRLPPCLSIRLRWLTGKKRRCSSAGAPAARSDALFTACRWQRRRV